MEKIRIKHKKMIIIKLQEDSGYIFNIIVFGNMHFKYILNSQLFLEISIENIFNYINNTKAFLKSGTFNLSNNVRTEKIEVEFLYPTNKIPENLKILQTIHKNLPQNDIITKLLKNIYYPENLEKALISNLMLEIYAIMHFKTKQGFSSSKKNDIYTPIQDIEIYRNILINKIQKHFDFTLRDTQIDAIINITTDIINNKSSFLYGEVGSGKTIVVLSIVWLLINYFNYDNIAYMSPSKLLTEQTSKNSNLLLNEEIKNGKFFLGTHNIFFKQQKVNKKLQVLFIDEEHKFGVKFKENLSDIEIKISATPQPRTIKHLQFNQNNTYYLTAENISDIRNYFLETNNKIDSTKEILLKQKGKTFIVFSSVETLEKIYLELQLSFPDREIYKIHAKLPMKVINENFKSFQILSQTSICLVTSIFEIGIDIKDIRNLILFDYKYFGFSQMHQFRGRLVRGIEEIGRCFVLSDKNDPETSKQRAKIFIQTSSGIELTKYDEQIRGEGELFGTKQSGKQNTNINFQLYDTFKDIIEKYEQYIE